MKKIFKYLFMTLVLSSLFYSCETTELELLSSPNALSPDQADPDFLFNRIQIDYVSGVRSFNNLGARLSRIDYMLGSQYFSNYTSSSLILRRPWGRLYNDMIPDIAIIENLNSDDLDLSFHIGASKIMESHLLMLMVDYFGDVPFSQTNNASEFPFPVLDNSETVYNDAIALLDEAIALMNTNPDSGNALDLYYGGDTTKWIKLANTLKMRADLTQGNYTAVINATNVISDTADDFEFKHGTGEISPDERHLDYGDDYKSDGADIYQSNWLMNLMVGPDGDASPETDPRRRYYFYRQNWRTPGNYSFIEDVDGLVFDEVAGQVYQLDGDGVGETIGCSLSDVPTHLQFTPDEELWCSLPLGYWGRMHGNPEGTPPDNFLRTASGVYPAGGSFDGRADYFPYVGDSPTATFGQQVGLGLGGGGQGIEPLILASYVEFWKAEANFMLNNDASANLENALIMSIAKVQSFGALDTSANMDEAPDATTVTDFITLKVNEFNAADSNTALDANGYPVSKDKLDILGEQFFVTMYGGGADAFNFIRRTGYPRTISRSYQDNIGTFPRTFLYPSSETSSNPNVTQKTDFSTKTFWDTGVINPAN